MNKQLVLTASRFIVAGMVLVAVGTQLAYGIGTNASFSIVNFFSFFTILSNFLAAVVFLASGASLFVGVNRRQLDYIRGAATLYMVITGIVYALLLTKVDVQIPLPWVNAIIHYIFPIIILADWLIDPPAKQISPKLSLGWLTFPLMYAVYSLIRGPFANHWYPYPFINVEKLGYLHVLVNCVLLAIAAAVLAVVIISLPRLVWVVPKRTPSTS